MEEDRPRAEPAAVDVRGIEPRQAYAIAERGSGEVTALLMSGEFDLVAAPALRARIDAASGAHGLVLDLSGVTFVDSSALKELLRARQELPARGMRLVLAGVPRPVRRLLDLTGTSELFEDAPDADAAVARLRSP
jgi:anti-sigma B factor antagonist